MLMHFLLSHVLIIIDVHFMIVGQESLTALRFCGKYYGDVLCNNAIFRVTLESHCLPANSDLEPDIAKGTVHSFVT